MVRKGFQMSISAVIAIVISVIFVAVLVSSFTGVFDTASSTALNMLG